MEKLNFETVEQVAEYLQNKCYTYLDTDCESELKNIEVEGMEKFLPKENGKENYLIYFWLDDVVAIFATEDRIEYIWQSRDNKNFKYEAMVI